ncbi:hypothetical protein [Streptomyces pactum]|uniref:Receptor ligand binding region domain-containing protein n=1 Tax=Streptomyces pactum TaxID=68249 RepID=A0A1S6J1Z0_9ACTN|nr:hypothetical protein [Streptomyces pactum]AQS65772.1 hypothetical protein B1H29_01400 [Streptomyces pactum]
MPETGRSFTGMVELVCMLRELTRRRRFLAKTSDDEVRGERPLPLVCLVRDRGPNDFLIAVNERLEASDHRSSVPHAYVDAESVNESVTDRWTDVQDRSLPLIPLLDELRTKLAGDRFGPGRPFRFDYYRLADWLTGQHLSPTPGRHEQQLADLLRQWTGRAHQSDPAALTTATAATPSPLNFVGSTLYLLVEAGRRMGLRWLGRRSPGLGREARWFMRRQPFMVPRHSTSFRGFAERLTERGRETENPEQIKKLLVHAFLEDLRRAYRRRRWSLLPKRSGWRRTAYTIVLLDNLAESNGGWELLRLISEVRNETGELDPLLVVAACDERPAALEAGDSGMLRDPQDALDALKAWLDNLPSKRQRLAENARYLWIALPPARVERNGRHEVWERAGGFRPPTPPFLSRRGIGETLLALVMVLVLLPVTRSVVDSWAADCVYFRDGVHDGVSVRTAQMGPDDRQCVGYSDDAVQIFGSNKRLVRAQQAIFAQNETAKKLHGQQPGRPYLSIVHFVGLTHREAAPDTDHAAAEELEGLLLRQRAQNVKSKTLPLLRVIVANGGDGMRKAPEVVRDMLRPLFDDDPSVVAVVGLDRTVEETEQAITEIGLAGVPTIGTTLTGSGLGERSPLYFQMVPDNTEQAQLVAEYARHLETRRVTLYHPARTDSYLRTLVEAATAELDDAAVPVTEATWRESAGEVDSLCADGVDRSDEIVYYIGREDDFGDFLRSATSGCTSQGKLPLFVAADAVSRFVAQRENREHSSLANRSMSYVGMGSLVTLAGPSCAEEGRPAPLLGVGTPLDEFCAGYKKLRTELSKTLPDEESPQTPWPAERTGTTYDVAGLLVRTTSALHQQLDTASEEEVAPHRAAIAQGLREVTFQGATGEIDFRASRIGNERNLAILRISDIHDMDAAPTCSYMKGDLFDSQQRRDPETGCPG